MTENQKVWFVEITTVEGIVEVLSFPSQHAASMYVLGMRMSYKTDYGCNGFTYKIYEAKMIEEVF